MLRAGDVADERAPGAAGLLVVEVDEVRVLLTKRGVDLLEDERLDEARAALNLAEAALARLAPLLHHPAAYAPLRTHARHTATSLFASTDATLFWDDFYTRST